MLLLWFVSMVQIVCLLYSLFQWLSSIPSRLCKLSAAWYIGSQYTYINYSVHKTPCLVSGHYHVHLSASMRLSNLHWLPVCKRIDFKLALTTYKILFTHQPAYPRSLLLFYEPTSVLRLSSQQLLSLPTATTDFGRRAFSY